MKTKKEKVYKITDETRHLIHCIFQCIETDIDNGVKASVRNNVNDTIISHVHSVRAFQRILINEEYTDDSKRDMMKYRNLYEEQLKGFY